MTLRRCELFAVHLISLPFISSRLIGYCGSSLSIHLFWAVVIQSVLETFMSDYLYLFSAHYLVIRVYILWFLH